MKQELMADQETVIEKLSNIEDRLQKHTYLLYQIQMKVDSKMHVDTSAVRPNE
jgi:hypothetical protein